MTVQNIVLIASVVGLLFSFYYIYTLDFKLRELKKEIKKQEEEQEKEQKEEQEKNKESLQEHKLTFSDQVICYNQKDNYSDSEISDMSIISENEANWVQDSDPSLGSALKIEEIYNTPEGEITEEYQEDQEDEPLKELEELDPDAIEVISESSSDQVFLPNTCRVAIKTGPRKGKLCGKKTSGVPYCSRHGLYT